MMIMSYIPPIHLVIIIIIIIYLQFNACARLFQLIGYGLNI